MKVPGIERSFTIAFTLRSGSNALCDLLTRNRLGKPGELFQSLPRCASKLDWLGYFTAVTRDNQTGGIFGSKMSSDHRAAVDERMRAACPGYGQLGDVLANHRWVRLLRRDRFLQAISWCRAELSQKWARTTKGLPVREIFAYDFFHILSRLMIIQAAEAAWDAYFERLKIKPYVVIYEDFFSDSGQQLRNLVEYLGGLPPSQPVLELEPRLEIQRDAESVLVRSRFIHDLGRIGEMALSKQLGREYTNWNRFFFEFGWRDEDPETQTAVDTRGPDIDKQRDSERSLPFSKQRTA